ncbi:MAG: hypothetical protein IPN76_26220 [Saprospiraceae bacterium]|nr:hypothetical protein [Saprospiraceae bacterium]
MAWTSEWNLNSPVITWTQGGPISLTPDLCNVETLVVDFNDLEGAIPDIQLPLLKHLNLAGNNLAGAIPPFTNLGSLEEVFFSVNKLVGPVPNFASLPNLKKLHFHTNNIAGGLPNFSNLPNLRELSASNNKIDNLPIFTFFDASNQPFDLIEVDSNRLTFDDILPLFDLNYSTNGVLRYQGQDSVFTDTTISVTLGGNKTIDLGFDEGVTNNIYIWYKGNTPIDTVIGDNSRTFSNIQSNQLGTYYVKVTNPMAPQLTLHSRPITLTTIPPCDPQEDRMILMDFYNAMGGNTTGFGWDVDDHWGMGNNLQNWYGIQVNAQGCVVTIDLDDNTPNPDWQASPNGQGNNLIGQLQLPLFNLPYLEKLYLRNNAGITGPLHGAIGDLTQLKELSLSKTGLIDSIPASIGNLDNLVYFEIDHTNISGPLPDAIGSLPALRYLEIDNNPNLNGNLPNTLGNLINLQGFYANHCDFDGPIPPGLAMLPQLNTLELQHNRLEGTVPVFSGPVLLGLRLDTNRLENLPPLMLNSLGNNTWQGLQVQMNRLTFEDILPNMGIFNSNPPSNYAGQDSVFVDTTVTLNIGDIFRIDMGIDTGVSPANQFTWYKIGNSNPVTPPIANNGNILNVNNNSDAGIYYCRITNPGAPELTLISRPITLVVDACPSSTLDSTALLAYPACAEESNSATVVLLPFNIPSPIAFSYRVDNGIVESLTLPVVGGAVNFQTSGPLSPGSHSLQVFNITDANNCLYTSTFIQNIDVFPPSSASHILPTLCSGDSIVVNNTVYNEANPSGSEVLPNADVNGCDSTILIFISFISEAVGNLSQAICQGESLTVNGTIYDENNPNGTEFLPNGSWQGCDSMLNVSLSFHPLAVSNQNQVLCTGGSLTVNGVVYDEDNPTGTETIPGGSWLGCDSTVHVDLSFGAVATGTLSQVLCAGESLTVNGTVYDASNPSGSQTFPNGSWQGCDSMLNVSLSFHPLSVSNQDQVLCTGGSLVVNGVVYDEDNPIGTETIPGGSWLGCDSTVHVDLSFGAVATGTLSQTLCPGDSLTVNGTVYDALNPTGSQSFPNGSWQGCDSMLNVSLGFHPLAVSNLNQVLYGRQPDGERRSVTTRTTPSARRPSPAAVGLAATRRYTWT